MFGPRTVFLLFVPLMISSFAAGQCCDVPSVHIMSDSLVLISDREVWTTDVFVNGTLVVDDELLITGTDVVMGGAGISVTENGTLIVRDSRISTHPNNTGFYIENKGRLELYGTVLDRCSDPDNSIIGVYQTLGSLLMDGSKMLRSGLINCQSSSINIQNTSISGLVSSESDCIIKGGNVTSMGLTQYGKGKMVVNDVEITSSIPFSSPISAISSLEGGELVLEDIRIDGSYDGGLYARNGRLSISSMSISLQDGLYGIRSENTTYDRLEDVEVEGTLEGITFLGTSSDVRLYDCTIRANYTGLLWNGEGLISVSDCSFYGSTYGAIVQGPAIVEGCIFNDNLIGLMAAEGALKGLNDNSFIDFTKWGIQQETWTATRWPENIFEPGPNAISNHAWWGTVDVSVISELGFLIEGAELEMTTIGGPQGEEKVRIAQGPVGMVWGREKTGILPAYTEVDLTAKWGTSSNSVHFLPNSLPKNAKAVSIVLPLSDLNVTSISRRGSIIDVTVELSGPEVRDARVTIFVDGSYRTSELFELGQNGTKTFSFPLSGLKEGDREVTARVLSRDEYSGSDGALQGNNELSITFKVKENGAWDGPYVPLALCIMFVSIAIMVLLGYVKKNGPKV